MTAPETDVEFRTRVVEAASTLLVRLLDLETEVTEDTNMAEELGLSSSLGLELLLELEDQLGVQIDVEAMNPDELQTVGELATYIAGHSEPE